MTDDSVRVECTGPALVQVRDATREQLVAAGVPAALAGRDATLWGAAAAPEASVRLGWLDCAEVSRPLLGPLAALREELAGAGLTRVVLAGMGGSSLAPEVITRSYGAELTVLDTTDPQQVGRVLADRLASTVVVVSSKSGGTTETDSHRRAFEAAFRGAGMSDAEVRRRFVVVTDPGSPLDSAAADAGYRVFYADPDVGGRYSALTAFGLVPSALAGVPLAELLDQAAALAPRLAEPDGNPGLDLGSVLGGAGAAGHDKVVLAATNDAYRGFGDWAEQLVAESTGKDGKGLLPVVVEGPAAPGFAEAADLHLVSLGGAAAGRSTTAVAGPLGALFLAWEYAVAVAGRVIGINPFDQPNVQESKDNTKAVLEAAGDGPLPAEEPVLVDGAVQVYGEPAAGARDLPEVLTRLLAEVPARGYLAVMAYLDRVGDAAAAGLRPALAARVAHPVTFGWGPRFLHSTGQYHKGGPPVGVFLQITAAVERDVAIPGRPYTFGRLQAAQALGDLQALRDRGRPAVRLHLTDRAAGLRQLLAGAAG